MTSSIDSTKSSTKQMMPTQHPTPTAVATTTKMNGCLYEITDFSKGYHDAKEHLFILENDWTRQNFVDKATFIIKFIATLWDEVLQWFMKFEGVTQR